MISASVICVHVNAQVHIDTCVCVHTHACIHACMWAETRGAIYFLLHNNVITSALTLASLLQIEYFSLFVCPVFSVCRLHYLPSSRLKPMCVFYTLGIALLSQLWVTGLLCCFQIRLMMV